MTASRPDVVVPTLDDAIRRGPGEPCPGHTVSGIIERKQSKKKGCSRAFIDE
jgi:hypothetical protein